jgi:methionyl-tRNA formyltransferase
MKNNKINIAYFGTSDRSIRIIKSLEDNFNLVACITKSDTKIGRKKELRQTEVKAWALKHNKKLFEITKLNKKTKLDLINFLKENKIDLGIVADFSFIIPQSIISTPPFQLINIHFSLLPQYRGASPVQFAIKEKKKYTGVTFYIMDKGMDTGDIIYQFEEPILKTDTSEELYSRLFKKSAHHLPKVIEKYVTKELHPTKQEDSIATYTRSSSNPKHTFIFKEDAYLDTTKDTTDLEAEIRAFYNWPISWCYLKDLTPNTFNNFTELKENINKNLKIKIYKTTIIENNLNPITVQVEGKNKTDWNSFLNGYCKNN